MTTYDGDFAIYRWIVGNMLANREDPWGDRYPCAIAMDYTGAIHFHADRGKIGITKYPITTFADRAALEAHNPTDAVSAIRKARALVVAS